MIIHYLVRIAMILVLLGTMGDVWLTLRDLAAGASEANPVMRFLMHLLDGKWVIARMVFGLFNIWLVIHNPQAAESWMGLLSFTINILLLAWVLWNNIQVLETQTK